MKNLYRDYYLNSPVEREVAKKIVAALTNAAFQGKGDVPYAAMRSIAGARLHWILKGLRNGGIAIGSLKQGSNSVYYLAMTPMLARRYARQMNREHYSELISRIRSIYYLPELREFREDHLQLAIEVGRKLKKTAEQVHKDALPVHTYKWLEFNGHSQKVS